jgi:hypothetical protein
MKALPYSLEDGRVLRAPFPWLPYGKRIVGSYPGGWVAAAIGCRIDVVNLFTCAWELSKKEITCTCGGTYPKFSTRKIIFSKDPASEGCILVAMSRSCIALGRLGSPGKGWTIGGCCAHPKHTSDVVFCNGDLYVLSYWDCRLYKFAIRLNKYNVPELTPLEGLTIHRSTEFYPYCIFELDSKIATAVDVTSPTRTNTARTFRVFELARNDTTKSYKLMEVTSLGDHALFLGPGFCKAVRVPTAGTWGEVRSNCIYYSHLENDDSKCLAELVDLGSCTVYCYKSGVVDHSESQRIMTRGYHYYGKSTHHELSCLKKRAFKKKIQLY